MQPDSSPPVAVNQKEWNIVKSVLRKHVPGYEVWAFGSRARGRPKPFSDLDLAVVTDKPLSLDLLAALAEAFSESDLPWKVDLVDWATTSPSFREIIGRDKVVVQPATKIGASVQHRQQTEPTTQ